MKNYLVLLIFTLSAALCFSACGTDPSVSEIDLSSETFEEVDKNDALVLDIIDRYFYLPSYRERTELKSVYGTERVTQSDLTNGYKLLCLYRYIVFDSSFNWADYRVDNFDGVPDDIYCYVLPVELFSNAAKVIFGSTDAVEIKTFITWDSLNFSYEAGKHTPDAYEVNSYGGGDDPSHIGRAVTRVEKSENYLIIYDIFASLIYDGETGKTSFYGDSAGEKLTGTVDGDVEIYLLTTQKNGEKYASQYGEYMQSYKHTFALAADGTYYWVSTEPAVE